MTKKVLPSIWLTVAIVTTTIFSTGCIEYLDDGELGRARYFGEVRGAAPLNLLPPISDRDGNVYVLYGSPNLNQAAAYIGHARGGWTTECEIHQSDSRGAHGWVGRGDDRAWYWSGDALVGVSGTTGGCSQILKTDPRTGANVLFRAVIPLVVESPSRRTVPAMVQTASDRAPFHVLVDLDLGRYSNSRPFEPAAATDVAIVGVGADRDSGTGFAVVRYQLDEQTVVEGLFFDEIGTSIARVPITGASAVGDDALLGYLQSIDGKFVIGLLETGELIKFDREGGTTVAPGPMTRVGVHKWDDKLYVVGTDSNGQPQIAAISATGELGAAQAWTSSLAAMSSMNKTLAVLDERSEPRQTVGWSTPKSAIGVAPFLSAHRLDAYADGTTGWLLAGPSFQNETNPQTSVAFAPIGVSYP